MKHQLDFEKPIVELQNKLEELKKHPESPLPRHQRRGGNRLDRKEAGGNPRQIFANLSAWDRIKIARHPKRPFTLDYLKLGVHRLSRSCTATGCSRRTGPWSAALPASGGHKVMVIGTQKGRDTKENILRNFGSAHPEGYRKALRLMRLADKFRLPIITLIDTAGAYPGIGAEERHIAEAIAVNLREMMVLEVPIIAAVIGEGGSGGALGIGVADRVLILENAYYSVISPEGCAAILWKDRAAAAKAAEALKITARHLLELGLVDEIVPEPLGGAHTEPRQCGRDAAGVSAQTPRAASRFAGGRPPEAALRQVPRVRPFRRKAARGGREDCGLRPAGFRLGGPKSRSECSIPSPFGPSSRSASGAGASWSAFTANLCRPMCPIGESWEISDRPGDVSVIANGPLAGKDLRWLMENHAADLLGGATAARRAISPAHQDPRRAGQAFASGSSAGCQGGGPRRRTEDRDVVCRRKPLRARSFMSA